MKPRPAKIRPVIRAAAAASVLLWLMAVANCTVECLSDDAHPAFKGVNQTVAATPQSHNSKPTGHHEDLFCNSIHSICPVSPSAALIRPDFGFAACLNSVSPAPLLALTLSETRIRRQPPDRLLVFTPEVSLGPAYHSLAPPTLA